MALCMSLINSIRPLFIESLGATVIQISYVISVSGLSDCLFRTPSGILSDRIGRKKLIILSIVLASIPPLFYSFATHWEQIILWGMLFGTAYGLFMPSRQAIIAEYTPPSMRTTIYSVINLSWPLGTIIGPFVGGFLVDSYGWFAVFYLAIVVYVVTIIPATTLGKIKAFPDTMTTKKKPPLKHRSLTRLIALTSLSFFTGLAIGTSNTLIPLYLQDKFALSALEIGFFISVGFGVTTFLTQIPAGYISNRYGRKKTITLSMLLLPIFFFLWPFMGDLLVLLAVYMAIFGLWSMTWPGLSSLTVELYQEKRLGLVSGITQTGIMLGFTIGPILGGYLWESFSPAFPFYASTILSILCIPSLYFI